MLAAKAMGDFGEKVYACESYIPMVKLMRGVLRQNGMDKRVRVFNKRSDELKIGLDLPSKADVLVLPALFDDFSFVSFLVFDIFLGCLKVFLLFNFLFNTSYETLILVPCFCSISDI